MKCWVSIVHFFFFIFSCTSMKIQKYINGNKNTFEGKNKAHLNGNENMSKSCTLLLFIFSRTLIEIQKQDRNSVRWCASLNCSLYWLIRWSWIILLSFELIGLIEYLTIESFMRYLIKVGLMKYLTVESFMRY